MKYTLTIPATGAIAAIAVEDDFQAAVARPGIVEQVLGAFRAKAPAPRVMHFGTDEEATKTLSLGFPWDFPRGTEARAALKELLLARGVIHRFTVGLLADGTMAAVAEGLDPRALVLRAQASIFHAFDSEAEAVEALATDSEWISEGGAYKHGPAAREALRLTLIRHGVIQEDKFIVEIRDPSGATTDTTVTGNPIEAYVAFARLVGKTELDGHKVAAVIEYKGFPLAIHRFDHKPTETCQYRERLHMIPWPQGIMAIDVHLAGQRLLAEVVS